MDWRVGKNIMLTRLRGNPELRVLFNSRLDLSLGRFEFCLPGFSKPHTFVVSCPGNNPDKLHNLAVYTAKMRSNG